MIAVHLPACIKTACAATQASGAVAHDAPGFLAGLWHGLIFPLAWLVSLFAFGGIYAAGTFGWHTIQIGTFGIMLAIAGALGAWLGGKLDDGLGPKRVIAGSLSILLFAIGLR